MLNSAYGGVAAGGRSSTRSVPSTTSSMKVKSRSMSPWLKTWIGLPSRMARAKSIGDMSGRPHGP